MKKVFNVFLAIFCIISAILAFAFVIIEGRLLIFGDWLVYDNAFNGFVRYALRLILSLFALLVTVVEVINLKKKNLSLKNYLFFAQLSLLALSVVCCIFATNFVGIACLVLSLILSILKTVLIVTEL